MGNQLPIQIELGMRKLGVYCVVGKNNVKTAGVALILPCSFGRYIFFSVIHRKAMRGCDFGALSLSITLDT